MDSKLLSTDRPIALYYALVENVITFTRDSDSHCTVSLNEGWKKINTSIGSIDIKEDSPKQTNSGDIYETNLTATIPGHKSTLPEKSINGRKALLKVVYRSGLIKIIGNKELNPRLQINTSSKKSTYREIKIEFKGTSANLYHS